MAPLNRAAEGVAAWRRDVLPGFSDARYHVTQVGVSAWNGVFGSRCRDLPRCCELQKKHSAPFHTARICEFEELVKIIILRDSADHNIERFKPAFLQTVKLD